MTFQTPLLTLALCFLLTACTKNSSRDVGPGNGGGGDPRVAAFLDAATAACTWMQRESDLSSKAGACRAEVVDLTASVNDRNRVARVYSDDQPALDHGVPKDAVTDLNARRIHINIQRWERASDLERQVTAAMEMALLLGIPNRYSLGKRLTAQLAASVAKASPEQLATFQEWAYKYTDNSHLKTEDGQPYALIQGKTDDQIPCALFITDKFRELKDLYISLGVGTDIHQETEDRKSNYIGGFVINDQPDLRMTAHEIYFRSISYEVVGLTPEGSQISVFSDRRLLIETSDSGQVFRVTGTSSRLDRPVVCNMKM